MGGPLTEKERLQWQLRVVHDKARAEDEKRRKETALSLKAWRAKGGPQAWITWIENERAKSDMPQLSE